MRTEEEIRSKIASLSKKFDTAKYSISYDASTDRFVIAEIRGAKMTASRKRKDVALSRAKDKRDQRGEIATDFKGEIWKPVMWGGGCLKDEYEVSNYGRVARPKDRFGNRYLIVEYDYKGNNMCQLNLNESDGTRHCISLQHVVAETFIPNPEGFQNVSHRDGDYHNNAVSNLEWC